MTLRARTGFTLVEALIATFVITTALLLCIWLIDASLRHMAESERRQLGTVLAENALEEMRQFADANFGAGLTSFDGVTRQHPEYPQFEVKTHAALQPLSSPCTSLEWDFTSGLGFPGLERKVLEESAWLVEAEVSWSPRAADRVVLTSLIGDWRNPSFSVAVDPDEATVAADGEVTFKATASDAYGAPLPDLVFTWYVRPRDGNGTMWKVSRDGRISIYRNTVRTYTGEWATVPGACEVVALGFYRGELVEGVAVVTNEGE
ncbi:MAG: hypothetical protein AB7S38_29485 [Vulcanimicrobiota bacterium]